MHDRKNLTVKEFYYKTNRAIVFHYSFDILTIKRARHNGLGYIVREYRKVPEMDQTDAYEKIAKGFSKGASPGDE